jgi:hypothetical protein
MLMEDAIKCIDPESSLVLLYYTARSVDIMNWDTNARSTVTINDGGERVGSYRMPFSRPHMLHLRGTLLQLCDFVDHISCVLGTILSKRTPFLLASLNLDLRDLIPCPSSSTDFLK